MAQQLNIDLDRLRSIALVGIHRAYVFMGLGINAARDENMVQYELSDTFHRLSRNQDEDIDAIKKEFGNWIIGCGLREVSESFNIYLTGIFRSAALIYNYTNDSAKISLEKVNKFERIGIGKQLKKLRAKFGISTQKDAYLISISKARNCITHRKGIVKEQDSIRDGKLDIKWLGTQSHIKTNSGEIIHFDSSFPAEGILIKDDGVINLEIIERVKQVKLGEQIIFTPNDLSEICFTFRLATDEILQQTIEYLQSNGIIIQRKNT